MIKAENPAPQWRTRTTSAAVVSLLSGQGVSPLMAKIYAGRGVQNVEQIGAGLAELLNPAELLGIDKASDILITAIHSGKKILIVADYDCDGATACAVAIRGLILLGADAKKVDFLVPDRFKLGYGLSPELVDLASLQKPDLIVTVDNGIASVDGVARARAVGIQVIVTDHHLPGAILAEPDAMVNPNQPGCTFKSKSLAGVGVMFYTLLATRTKLREQGFASGHASLQSLLDLVALGTVADLVPLDRNNRILVHCGFKRILAGKLQPGLRAILQIAGKSARAMQLRDLGFTVGPRLNAAGRLSDMSLGIRCLISDDEDEVNALAAQLNEINAQRKELQQSMVEQAQLPEVQPDSHSLTVFREDWHQGIVGLVASRLKDKWLCPSFALAPVEPESTELRGSGRSIAGVHLRDALDIVAKNAPEILEKFGGHSMAAGLTIQRRHLPQFERVFNLAVAQLVGGQLPGTVVWTDGLISADEISLENALAIQAGIWGQQFEAPLFEAKIKVSRQTLIKDKHLKLWIEIDGKPFQAIRFFYTQPAPEFCRIAFSLSADSFQGRDSVSLLISHIEPDHTAV